jgi:CheY-like chemotaxis protein
VPKSKQPVRQSDDRTVLLVDDTPEYRRPLAHLLRIDHGLEVLETSSGLAALTVLENTDVDLVVSDYQMPGLDGIELLAVIRVRWPRVRRVLLTAWSTGEMVDTLDYPVLDKGLAGWLLTERIAELARAA